MKRKKKGAFRWIFRYSRKQMLRIVLIALVGIVSALSCIVLAVFSRKVIDIATGRLKGSVFVYCILLLVVIGVQAVLNILESNLTVRAGCKIEIDMKQGVFGAILKKQTSQTASYHSGDFLNRLTSDVEVVVGGCVVSLPQSLSLAVKLVVGFVVLLLMDAKFTCFLAIVGAVAFLFSFVLRNRYKKLHREIQQKDGKARSFMQECLENISIIKSFVKEKTILANLLRLQNDTYQVRLKRNAAANIANTGALTLFSGGYYLALVFGALQIADGKISYGMLTEFLLVFNQVIDPFKSMSGILLQFFSVTASAERLMEIENLCDEPEPKSKQADAEKLYREMNCIRIDRISFQYGTEQVFKNASGVIKKNTLTAIVGCSGVGKSTLLKLMLGLVEADSGEIRIETADKNRRINTETRRLFSYVPQGNMILSGTIKENITFFRDGIEEKTLRAACWAACVSDFTNNLSEGLNTVIGERGMGLSEGQNQRIAVARALLSDSPVLLFDEATSALDNETEKKLLRNLKTFKNKTCIFVSHRNSTVEDCDAVLRIENGKIREEIWNGQEWIMFSAVAGNISKQYASRDSERR